RGDPAGSSPHPELAAPRPFRAPALALAKPHPPAARRSAPATDDTSSQRGGQLDRPLAADFEVERPAGQVRPQPQALDVSRRKGLQPDRLPDPGGRRVEDAFGGLLPVLLAAREAEVGEGVPPPHGAGGGGGL